MLPMTVASTTLVASVESTAITVCLPTQTPSRIFSKSRYRISEAIPYIYNFSRMCSMNNTIDSQNDDDNKNRTFLINMPGNFEWMAWCGAKSGRGLSGVRSHDGQEVMHHIRLLER